MATLDLKITLHKNDDNSFSIKFMATELLNLPSNTSEQQLEMIYEGVTKAFYLGLNTGIEAIQNGATGCSIISD